MSTFSCWPIRSLHDNRHDSSVKVGVLSQTPKQILANIQTALPVVVSHIKNGWENIQSLYIKTSSSISLPIWSCDLSADAGGRWTGLTLEKEDEDTMSAVETPSRSPTPAPPPSKKTPRKPSNAALPEAEQPPKKKVKSTKSTVDRTAPPQQTLISHKEVKVKRSTEVGEKKKDKVVKGKMGRSPKDALLGKKVG